VSSTVASGALGYAFALGLVGAANPCGLPLVPAYLSLFIEGDQKGRSWHPVKALASSAWVTAGFAATFGVIGLLLGAVVGAVESAVPWMMVPFGVVLAGVGAAALMGRRLPVPQPSGRLGGRGGGAMFAFGVVYALASIGCALPLFLAAVGANLDGRGSWAVFGASLAYALGMGLLLAVLALAAASARRALVRAIRPAGRAGQVIGASLLIASGLYLAFDWAETLWNSPHTPVLVGAVNRVQASVSGWMSDHYTWLGLAFASAVIGVLLASAAEGFRGARPKRDLAHD
jgi:cytochrome c-type biogenesis protein